MYDEDKRSDMTESIRKYGVMQPLIVRPDPEEVGKYEILAGNNRCRCSRDAGKATCPAIIKENLTENEAQIYIAFTNLLQRGFNEIKITEQAAVIAAYHSELFSKEKASEIAQELAEMVLVSIYYISLLLLLQAQYILLLTSFYSGTDSYCVLCCLRLLLIYVLRC